MQPRQFSTIQPLNFLEPRRLLAGVALAVVEKFVSGRYELTVTGTAAADTIAVKKTSAGLIISNGTWTTTKPAKYALVRINGGEGNDKIIVDKTVTTRLVLHGNGGNDSIVGGSADDNVFGDLGVDTLNGGLGNDTLTDLGGSNKLSGGDGADAFWLGTTDSATDVTTLEKSHGLVHTINAFADANANGKKIGVGSSLNSPKLADPALTTSNYHYANFASSPLFSDAGPRDTDVVQGDLDDCYFLVSLAAVAKTSATTIRNTIADLGDGTYAVQFTVGGRKTFVRVDGDLPVGYDNNAAYAQFGAQHSTWPALIEKAWAMTRDASGRYDSTNIGWMSEAFRAIGVASKDVAKASITTASNMMKSIESMLAGGKSITIATASSTEWAAGLVDNHAYEIERVITSSSGKKSLVLRNPWGIDGNGNDGQDDGYVTVSAETLFRNFQLITASA